MGIQKIDLSHIYGTDEELKMLTTFDDVEGILPWHPNLIGLFRLRDGGAIFETLHGLNCKDMQLLPFGFEKLKDIFWKQ